MAFYLEKAIFINRAPFEHLELDFKEKGINVLSAINGKGKTTILSHVVDAFYELARPTFSNEFNGKENLYYRYSSPLDLIKNNEPSFVFLRFKKDEQYWDYVDVRNKCSKVQFESVFDKNKVLYEQIRRTLDKNKNVKKWSVDKSEENVKAVFSNNVLTYFPAYRYEDPGYLNDPYKVVLSFKKDLEVSGFLPNDIEVVSNMRNLANWLMDLVLDYHLYNSRESIQLRQSFNHILSKTLSGKVSGDCRIGIGPRSNAGSRISIVQDRPNNVIDEIYPTIFNISSGEAAMLCLFGELLHQADNIGRLLDVSGIVLIDEVDKHLHIKLQKEILPKLFVLFPNIQFIASSHSPFLNMGLADEAIERTQIIDLDNNGIICEPTNNDLYREVYEMMIQDNQRFADRYNNLINQIRSNTKPLIITEGKTDYRHIKKAIEKLERNDIDVDFFQVPDKWGSSKLKEMLESISRIKQQKIIIGIFDRDEPEYLSYLNAENQQYKTYGDSNVYAFAIPLVNENIYGDTISIEHYYNRNNLLKEEPVNHRRLFLGSEFYASGNSKDGKYQTKISNIKHKVDVNGIIDEKVFDSQDLEQVNSIALTKDAFASLIETDMDYINDFNFDSFNQLLNIIDSITKLPLYT